MEWDREGDDEHGWLVAVAISPVITYAEFHGDGIADAALIVSLRNHAGVLLEIAEKAERVLGAIMASHSGGDSSMIFDEYDAAAERRRHGWYSVNDAEIDELRRAVRALREVNDEAWE